MLNFGAVRNGYERLISLWKEVAVHVRIRGCKYLNSENHKLASGNPFARLIKNIPLLSQIVSRGVSSKDDVQRLGHFTSTRNFPCGGVVAMKKALRTFHETVSGEFVVPSDKLDELNSTCKKLGDESYRLLSGKYPFSSTHISLNMAGDYDIPSLKGGRGEKIRLDIEEVLGVIPEESQWISLPCGLSVYDRKGVPRWRTWMRSHEPPGSDHPKSKFGSNRQNVTNNFIFENRFWGHDEVLAYQILCVALVRAKEWGVFDSENKLVTDFPVIPARIASPPEPGGKVRVVTTTKWWVIILQQPLGHFLKECLRVIPRASDGLVRENQAWLYVNALSRARREPEFWFMSSDLQNATDAIPRETCKRLLRGFIAGLRLDLDRNPIFELALTLCLSDREFHMPVSTLWPRTFRGRRGVMMGEPLTKSVLTILNLAVEELAIRKYVVHDVMRHNVYPLWRAYRIGGDDHIGHGPLSYLLETTDWHRCLGSMISEWKHGYTQTACIYCEEPLYFKGTKPIETREINRKHENYENSIFVDIIKMRLLSPFSKVIETSDDRNTAIGKAKGLGKRLRWMSEKAYPLQWKIGVRERFISRMDRFLPRVREQLLHLYLPAKMGGLGLYISSEEIRSLWWEFRPETCIMIKSFIAGPSHRLRRLASGLCAAPTKRGYSLNDTFLEFIELYSLEEVCASLCIPIPPQKTVGELWTEFKFSRDLSDREVLANLETQGWYTFDNAVDRVSRGIIFSGILNKNATRARFKNRLWSDRFESLFSYIRENKSSLPDPHPPPTDGEWRRIFLNSEFESTPCYYLDECETVTIRNPFTQQEFESNLSIMDQLELGMPMLRLPDVDTFITDLLDNGVEEIVGAFTKWYPVGRPIGEGFDAPTKRPASP